MATHIFATVVIVCIFLILFPDWFVEKYSTDENVKERANNLLIVRSVCLFLLIGIMIIWVTWDVLSAEAGLFKGIGQSMNPFGAVPVVARV
jgi:hypothetical protein